MTDYLRSGLVDWSAKVENDIKIYGPGDRIRVGAHSRIDSGCIITVRDYDLIIGDHVHISAGVYIFGSSGQVRIGNGCFLSPRSIIYTATDIVKDACLVGPTFNLEDRSVECGNVIMKDHSGVMTGGIVMPGVTLGYAAVVGAQSICKYNLKNGEVMVGADHRILYTRDWQKIVGAYRANCESR